MCKDIGKTPLLNICLSRGYDNPPKKEHEAKSQRIETNPTNCYYAGNYKLQKSRKPGSRYFILREELELFLHVGKIKCGIPHVLSGPYFCVW